MDFKEKVGFICRNDAEWIECQKILFGEGYCFLFSDPTGGLRPSFNILQRPPISILDYADIEGVVIVAHDQSAIGYLTYFIYPREYNNDIKLYEAKVLLRKLKLEKLNESDL